MSKQPNIKHFLFLLSNFVIWAYRFHLNFDIAFSRLPSCAESHGLQTVDECARVPYEAPKERRGVCFGGFRPMKHVEEPRLRAEANFGAQARASARGGSP